MDFDLLLSNAISSSQKQTTNSVFCDKENTLEDMKLLQVDMNNQ